MIWYLAVPGQFIVEGIPNARPTLSVQDNILTTGRSASGLGVWETFTFEPAHTTPVPTVRESSATLVGYENGLLKEIWTLVGGLYVHPHTPHLYTFIIATAGYSRTSVNTLGGVAGLTPTPGVTSRISGNILAATATQTANGTIT